MANLVPATAEVAVFPTTTNHVERANIRWPLNTYFLPVDDICGIAISEEQWATYETLGGTLATLTAQRKNEYRAIIKLIPLYRQFSAAQLFHECSLFIIDNAAKHECLTWLTGYMYKGFEADKMMAQMKTKAHRAGVSQNAFHTICRQAAVLYLLRGASVTKIRRKSAESVTTLLDNLTNIYGLVERTGSPNTRKILENDAVTLGRLGIVGSTFISKFLIWAGESNNVVPLPPDSVLILEPVVLMPNPMRSPVFANIIPQTGADLSVYNALFLTYVAYMRIWDRVINPRRNKEETAKAVIQFQTTARTSNCYAEADRVRLMTEFGLNNLKTVAEWDALRVDLDAKHTAMP